MWGLSIRTPTVSGKAKTIAILPCGGCWSGSTVFSFSGVRASYRYIRACFDLTLVKFPHVRGLLMRNREETHAGKEDVDKACAIQLIQGDLSRPLIMGIIQTPTFVESNKLKVSEVSVKRNGKKVLIQADDELVLQCGKSCIVMTAEGTLYIRALYIDSHDHATQRLRGGSILVN